MRDFSGTLCSSIKQIKAPYLFDWEQDIALHAMQRNWASSLSERQVSWFFLVAAGKWASSCVDFGYTELFFIPELTSEFILSCDSVLGDSLVSIKKIEATYVFN